MLKAETLEELLYAVHNYGHAEEDDGLAWEEGVRAMLEVLYRFPEQSRQRAGVESVLRLLAECDARPDPEGYARSHVDLGLTGLRAE